MRQFEQSAQGQPLRAKRPLYTDPVEFDLMRGLKRLLDRAAS